MLRWPGGSWGFAVLLKGTSVVVFKVERVLYIHSPLNSLNYAEIEDKNTNKVKSFKLQANHECNTTHVGQNITKCRVCPLKGWQRLGSSLCLWISKQYDWLSMRHTDLCNRICTQTAGEIFTAVTPQKERFAGFHAPEIPFSLCLYAFLNEASKHLFAHCSYNFSILLRGGRGATE